MLNSENAEIEIVEESSIEIEIDQDISNENERDFDSEEFTTDYSGDENPEEKSSRFKDGEELTMVRVRFPGNAKSFPFVVGKRKFAYGQKVVAMSDRGMTVGYINSFPYLVTFNKSMLPIRSIAKVATEEDIKAQLDFRNSEKKAEVICLHLIEKHKLDMVLTHVEFIQFGKKAVFYFNAPERVDFRELVKDLVGDLKMRIELRQISVRDRAAALGSVGACGLQTCCSSFLKSYGNVSIKMAKNQNLALIPSKLNGVCGQIKCCIKYEDDVYADKRKNLPKEGAIVKTVGGDIGKVLRLHLLIEQFELITDFGAKRRYAVNQFNAKEQSFKDGYKFPETFEHVVDETKEVIGLVKEDQLKSEKFLEEYAHLKEQDDELKEIEYVADDLDEDLDDELDSDDDNEENLELKPKIQNPNQSKEQVRPKTENPNQNRNNNQQRPRPNNGQNTNRNDSRNQRPASQNNQNQNQNRKPNEAKSSDLNRNPNQNQNNNRPRHNQSPRPNHQNNRPNPNQNQNKPDTNNKNTKKEGE
jgi:cell fate regulator YaaT (PSP1 superfamily)